MLNIECLMLMIIISHIIHRLATTMMRRNMVIEIYH